MPVISNASSVGPVADVTAGAGGQFLQYGSTTNNLLMNLPGSNRLLGKPFKVRATGITTLAAGTYTSTVVASIYAGSTLATTGGTITSTAILATHTSAPVTMAGTVAVSVPWSIEANLQGGSLSPGTVRGLQKGISGSTITALGVLTNSPTGINFASEPAMQFAAGVVVGTNTNATLTRLNSFEVTAD